MTELTYDIETLLEATLTDLARSTNRAFPNRETRTNNVRIIRKEYQKYDDDKLLVKATCGGETSNYETSILFEGVQFTNPNDPQSITVNNISFNQLQEGSVQVKVRCTCMDFHWTFAWHNASENALIGDPPKPYDNYTGQRNPSNAPGICKHLFKLRSDLQADGLL